jgi:threonine aldolase
VYGEDPTVSALEAYVADLLGFEAALFTVTGSLANLLAVRALVQPGTEVLCESAAHIARAELGAHAAVSGVTMRTWTDPSGAVDLPAVEALLAPDLGPFLVKTTCVSVENTHNFAGGRTQPLGALHGLRALADRAGIGVHLDGARLWNASIATDVSLPDLAAVADTATVALSKGLGAPVGSLILGTAEHIGEARTWRKRLGGGWRQAGVLAAAGRFAIEHNLSRLADDHEHARLIAAAAGVNEGSVETNIVVMPTKDAAGVVQRCRDNGVLVSTVGAGVVRVVTHLDISAADAKTAADILARALEPAVEHVETPGP